MQSSVLCGLPVGVVLPRGRFGAMGGWLVLPQVRMVRGVLLVIIVGSSVDAEPESANRKRIMGRM